MPLPDVISVPESGLLHTCTTLMTDKGGDDPLALMVILILIREQGSAKAARATRGHP